MDRFILKIPEWKDGISFSGEWIAAILAVAVLAVGILLCFWGYRYFETMILVFLGCLSAAAGYLISRRMTGRLILQMCMVVIFAFLLVCIFYFLSTVWNWLLRKLKLHTAWEKGIAGLSPFLGAGIAGGVLYTRIYRSSAAAAGLAVILCVAGTLYTRKKEKERRVFYTYEDLIRLKPLEQEETDA